jgi:hypothetical protein
MKTLISRQNKFHEVSNGKDKSHILKVTFVFCLLSVFFSGSALFPQEEVEKIDDMKNKRLDILEKLESGKSVSSEEIWSSHSIIKIDDPEMSEIFELQSLPGPFFYHDYKAGDHVIISDKDLKEIHKKLSESMEELRKNIKSFHYQEDFSILKDELSKWSNSFRKEIEKVREELIRSDTETRSKSTVPSSF